MFVDFFKALVSPKETLTAILKHWKNPKAMVHSHDGYSDCFDASTGVLEGDGFALFPLKICQYYPPRTSMDLMEIEVFHTKKKGL